MLILLWLTLRLAAASPPACPDLSGLYILPGEDGHVEIVISQFQCDEASIVWRRRNYDEDSRDEYSVSLHNVFRPDTVMGKATTHASAGRFTGDTLEVFIRGR